MIRKKILISFILIIFLFQTLIPILNIVQAADETIDLEISTKEELIAFASDVNSGNSYEGKTVVLTNDINLQGSTSNQWTPIGTNSNNSFKGDFDGRNHTISGIYIDSAVEYQGLFGVNKGKILNLIVSNSTINLTKYKKPTADVGYRHYIGIIVGYSTGNIENCSVNNSNISIDINNNTDFVEIRAGMIAGGINSPAIITRCVTSGTVTNNLQQENIYARPILGGIIGSCNGATIEKCTNNAKIVNSNGQDIYIGGIVGDCTTAKIYDSCNKGSIFGTVRCTIGGITANISIGEIKNCFNNANIEIGGSGIAEYNEMGGIVGILYQSAEILNCYNVGNMTNGGSIVGNNKSDGDILNTYYLVGTASTGIYQNEGKGSIEINSKSQTEMKSANFVTLLNDSGTYFIQDKQNLNNGYPLIASLSNKIIQFNDENLYNALVEQLEDKIIEKNDANKEITISNTDIETITKLDLSGKNIVDITGIEQFPNLIELQLYDNKIENINSLRNNSNIELLNLNTNNLDNTDIQVIATMTGLKAIGVGNNKQIEDITPLFVLTNLEELNAYDNSIEDVTGIEKLLNLEKLNLQGNKITEYPEFNNIEDENLLIGYQYYVTTLFDNKNGQVEIELPQTFLDAQNSSSMYYSEEGLNLENCELNENGDKIVVDVNEISMLNAKIEIKSGKLQGTNLFLYGVSITYGVNVTEDYLSGMDIDLNGDEVIDEEDTQVMRQYIDSPESVSNEIQEKIMKIDVDYNEEINEVDYQRFLKYVRKESDILFIAQIDMNNKTNQDIIAQIQTLNPNIETNDEMYVFTSNDTHEFTILDEEGEQQVLIASVNNIDKDNPTYEVLYNIEEPTNSNVTVTIRANEELTDIYKDYENEYGEIQSTGWILSEDKMSIEKTYEENTNETVTIMDLAGNYVDVEIEVDNIFKDAPDSGEMILKLEDANGENYTQDTWKNKNIYISTDDVNKPQGTTLTYQINGQGEYTGSQVLSEDGEYEITLITKDTVGNTVSKKYIVKIDKTNPEIGKIILKAESSIGEELQNEVITNKNIYVEIEDGTDNLSGIKETYYILNEDEKVSDSQIYRDNGTYNLKLVTVDNAGNEQTSEYTFNISKEPPKLETEYSVNSDGSIEVRVTADKEIQNLDGWNLSDDNRTLTKTYYTNKTETIVVTDLLGNTTELTIKVTGITVMDFVIDIDYSKKELTNENVVVTITATKPMEQLQGWTIKNNGYIQEKEYETNTEENVSVRSTTGETAQGLIQINNIDKERPVVNVTYSESNNTNKDVTVKIISNEKLKPLDGWTLSTDRKILQKEYQKNVIEDIEVSDLVGNKTSVTIRITNIDKELPIVTVTYSNTEKTYEPVQVTIKANEKIQNVNGWELSLDETSLTKTFTENINETIRVTDLVGNVLNVKIEISNIMKKQEINTDIYEITSDNYILGIEPNTEINECIKNLGIDVDTSYTGIVKTGMTLKINEDIYTLIVKGDITQDGLFDIQDLSNLILHIAEEKELTGNKLKAADINLDKIVDIRDLSSMCLKIAGLD